MEPNLLSPHRLKLAAERNGRLSKNPGLLFRARSPGAFAFALACAAAAIVLRIVVDGYFGFGHAPTAPFYPAVVITTLAAGYEAGLLTALLCLAAFYYFVIPPQYTFQLASTTEFVDLALFAGALALVFWAANSYRNASAKSYLLLEEVRGLVRQLQARAGQLESVLSAGPNGILVVDLQGRVRFVNSRLTEMFGYNPEELLGGPVETLLPERFRGNHAHFRAAFANDPETRQMGVDRDLFGLSKDGREIPVEIGLGSFHDPDGQMAVAIISDITERKLAAERLALVARELEHRNRNVVARIKAILHLTHAETAAGLATALDARLDALARTDALIASTQWQGAELNHLITDQLSPYGSEQIQISGPEFRLSVRGAESFGMVVHELTTNAAKYGALSRPGGRLTVKWMQPQNGQLALDWIETGVSVSGRPTRAGFGTRVIDSLVRRELSGKIELSWLADGLHCHIDVSAEQVRAPN